ncbi:MAG: hypothetical protein WC932_04980 [archaeon]|jgi:hypothetical protein
MSPIPSGLSASFFYTDTTIEEHVLEPGKAFYSPFTQKLANYYPGWMELRIDKSSVGQQIINTAGIQLQELDRAFDLMKNSLHLSTADLNAADVLYKVKLSRVVALDEDNPPALHGDGADIIISDSSDEFLRQVFPTRIEVEASGLGASGVTEGLVIPDLTYGVEYYTPWVDQHKEEKDLYYNWDEASQKLIKFHLISEGMERPQEIPVHKEVLGYYSLLDHEGDPITGDFHGITIDDDRLYMLFGNLLYIFDARISLLLNTDASWDGNKEQSFLQAKCDAIILDGVQQGAGILVDGDRSQKWLWCYDNWGWIKYRLHYDYAIVDYDTNTIFFREEYTTCLVDGTTYDQELHNVWNWFDEYGLVLDTERLLGEPNEEYQARLLNVMKFRANSTTQGVIDGVTQSLDLDNWGYFPSGLYPENLFVDGLFPSGYPIYPSGNIPVDIGDVALVDALYTPAFYETVVDSETNIPTVEMVDYTKEILKTFPIFWGSGTPDQYGFIWDIAPFDGGYNNVSITPDFMALLPSGIDEKWYQSGIQDVNPLTSKELMVRLSRTDEDEWIPEVWNGDFHIHNKLYYLYAQGVAEVIPSGVTSYSILGSGLMIPGGHKELIANETFNSGLIHLASGTEMLPVHEFTDNGMEYMVSGNTLLMDPEHGELCFWYETSPSGWYTIPGWDFNPTHAALYDGFIWISDQRQMIDPSGSYTLEVTPDSIPFGGAGGGSVVLGTLLDTAGEPIIGADVYFRVIPSGLGELTDEYRMTGLTGQAYTFYNSPVDISTIWADQVSIDNPTNSLVVDDLITSDEYDKIWTVTTEASAVSGYPGNIQKVWMAYHETLTLTVASGEWLPVPSGWHEDSLGNQTYQGYVTIGGSELNGTIGGADYGDDLFNIDLTSIKYAGLQAIKEVGNTSLPFAYRYEIDDYTEPKDYGKVLVYAVTIPTGSVQVSFDTYRPVRPVNVVPNSPTAGQTTLYYGEPTATIDASKTYQVGYPQVATIESWAVWEGVETIHQFKSISMSFSDEQSGTFRLDDKFADFVSYLRYI